MRMCHFRPQNGPSVLNNFFFGINHYYYFHLPIGPFHYEKFKKILTADPDPFLGPKWSIWSKQFFWKIINIILIYLLFPFIVQNFKKILSVDPELEDAQFLGPKWPILPNESFFRKPVNEPCSFHSCLSTCQKSKSDINLLVKYWQLKNTEISFFWSMQFSRNVNEP